jgi:pyroglutamyl-peptidase
MEDQQDESQLVNPVITLDGLLKLDQYSFQVQVSQCNDGGFGLFTCAPILKNEIFLEYLGEILDFQQARARQDRSYMKLVNLNRHIDAIKPESSSLARYINDHPDPTKHNCKFCKLNNRIFIRAKRNISPGEELFIDYGRGHWLYCEDLAISEMFLHLRMESQQVVATQLLPKNTFICTFLSLHWKSKLGPGLGCSIRKVSKSYPIPNCKLQKNPLLRGTVFVQAIKDIQPGEELILAIEDSPSKLSGALYVTGFGKFRGVPENPTTKLIRNLQPYCNELSILGMAVWETSIQGVKQGLHQANEIIQAQASKGLQNLVPDAVSFVHFGVFDGAPCFYLESIAYNLAYFGIPDEGGNKPQNEPVLNADGDITKARRCKFDLVDLCEKLVKLGHNVEISTDPGRFICNYAYYSSLADITAGDWGHDDSLFVHVPSFNIANEEEQLKFARDLLWTLTRELGPSRNFFSLITIDPPDWSS